MLKSVSQISCYSLFHKKIKYVSCHNAARALEKSEFSNFVKNTTFIYAQRRITIYIISISLRLILIKKVTSIKVFHAVRSLILFSEFR